MSTALEYTATMTDQEIQEDLADAVLPALDETWEREVALAYRRARRRAPGWSPRKEGSNNHNKVPKVWQDPQAVADKLLKRIRKSGQGPARLLPKITKDKEQGSLACVICGDRFNAKRKDAKYCSARCRQTGSRRKDLSQIAS